MQTDKSCAMSKGSHLILTQLHMHLDPACKQLANLFIVSDIVIFGYRAKQIFLIIQSLKVTDPQGLHEELNQTAFLWVSCFLYFCCKIFVWTKLRSIGCFLFNPGLTGLDDAIYWMIYYICPL